MAFRQAAPIWRRGKGARPSVRFSHGITPSRSCAWRASTLLDTLFELLAAEPSAGVQAVLGYFLFVHIHPYSDGNGRLGRFILNTLLASGGYPWTVIRVEHRKAYMGALENASVRHDVGDFTRFVAAEMAASAELRGPKK